MPVERQPVSISQFAELMGIDPARFIGVDVQRHSTRVVLILEPDEETVRAPLGSRVSRVPGSGVHEVPQVGNASAP
jgi:hypothetical protein